MHFCEILVTVQKRVCFNERVALHIYGISEDRFETDKNK